MTVGERIQKIRTFRKMILDEFSAALGFEGKSISLRIIQYETVAHVTVTFEYGLVNDFLLEWNKMKNILKAGKSPQISTLNGRLHGLMRSTILVSKAIKKARKA